MIPVPWLLVPLALGIVLGVAVGRLFPVKTVVDAAWRAGWRASDGGIAPLNAEALAAEREAHDE